MCIRDRLKQDQTMYDAYTVMDTVIMGNQRLYDCGKEMSFRMVLNQHSG